MVDQAERSVNAKGPVMVIMEIGTAKNDIRTEPPFDFVEEHAAGAAQCVDSNSNRVAFHERQCGASPPREGIYRFVLGPFASHAARLNRPQYPGPALPAPFATAATKR